MPIRDEATIVNRLALPRQFDNSLLKTTSLFRDDLLRWQQLVTPAWLHGVVVGQAVPAAPQGDWCLLEVDCGPPTAFEQNHIPGAHYLDTHDLEDGPFWNKVADPTLLALLLRLGITCTTTVILYGRNQTAAARAAHLMLYAGVTDVRFLDGGFAAWQRAGLPFATGPSPPKAPAHNFGGTFPGCPHYLINHAQAQSLAKDATALLVSVRSWDEFSGKTSGYSYIEAKGDIPGARWGRAGDSGDVNSMSAYQNADGTLRAAQDIQAFWGVEGITPDKTIAFYCGTGWRASLAFYYAWLMGWEHISVYDGGWFEWSSLCTVPTTTTTTTSLKESQ